MGSLARGAFASAGIKRRRPADAAGAGKGSFRASHLGDLEGALGAYQKAMEQDPGRDEALAAVRALTSKPEVASNALDLLEEYYRDAGDLEQVVQLYHQRVEIAPTDADRVALLTEAAEIWEHDIGRPEMALARDSRRGTYGPSGPALSSIPSSDWLSTSGGWAEPRGAGQRTSPRMATSIAASSTSFVCDRPVGIESISKTRPAPSVSCERRWGSIRSRSRPTSSSSR